MRADYRYPTDLTDEQWEMLQSLLPERTWRPGGTRTTAMRPATYRQRYPVRQQDGQWRLIPKEFGHWNTIYGYFSAGGATASGHA